MKASITRRSPRVGRRLSTQESRAGRTPRHGRTRSSKASHADVAESLAAEAYTIVRKRIIEGQFALGQPISRRKLALELGMSFLPVSMALLRLEFEGLLESRARAGTRVRIPSPDEVRGHYLVREALEVQSAMLFADAATRDQRRELKKLAARVDALAAAPNRVPFVLAHQKLHRRIAECAGVEALSATIEQTHALASTWFCVTGPPPAMIPSTRHQHLVAALVSGDRERAAAAMREHISSGMQHTLDHLKLYFQLRKASGRTFFRSGTQPV